jgi:hypothetical protein
MTLRVLETSRLRGALAVRPWDPVIEQPTETPCRVSALRNPDRVPVVPAVRHTAGLFGFLTLRSPATYLVRIEPLAGDFLPSLRKVSIPAGGLPVPLTARLSPSPRYRSPRHSVTLRGTLYWNLTSPIPVRWAAVFASLADVKAPGVALSSGWTRSDGRGEFAVPLRTTPPNGDGKLASFTATIDVHAPPPVAGAPSDPADLSDLPIDADTDAANRAPAPPRRTIGSIAVAPGDDLSLNLALLETFVDGGVTNTVIFLSPI